MYKFYETSFKNQPPSMREKLQNISFSFIALILMLAGMGVVMLYSAANGHWNPWALNQLMRFGLGFTAMIVLALIDIRFFMRYAYVFYFLTLVLLIVVEVGGHVGMGAQRWINLGFMKLQPSELMKIALVLALARYFHSSSLQSIETTKGIIAPALMVLFPAFLVMTQPDLGTALMLVFTAGAMFFAVGVQLWKFGIIILGALISMPIAWNLLHDYQQNRVLTFLNPERDPLGAGREGYFSGNGAECKNDTPARRDDVPPDGVHLFPHRPPLDGAGRVLRLCAVLHGQGHHAPQPQRL